MSNNVRIYREIRVDIPLETADYIEKHTQLGLREFILESVVDHVHEHKKRNSGGTNGKQTNG